MTLQVGRWPVYCVPSDLQHTRHRMCHWHQQIFLISNIFNCRNISDRVPPLISSQGNVCFQIIMIAFTIRNHKKKIISWFFWGARKVRFNYIKRRLWYDHKNEFQYKSHQAEHDWKACWCKQLIFFLETPSAHLAIREQTRNIIMWWRMFHSGWKCQQKQDTD